MKINKDYILLILNCYKYKHKADKQKETWLKVLNNTNIQYFHVIGCKKTCNNNDYVFDYENNILYTNTNDDYLSLPDKVITAMYSINQEYNYKYIFKTDDDQMLTNVHFFDVIINLINSKKIDYGGFQIKVKDHYSNYYTVHKELPEKLFLKGTSYCNGRFYLLSKDAIENLLIKKHLISKHIIEDHAIGLYLDEKYKQNFILINSHKIFTDMN